MCKCAADKQSGPLGKKPTVRWSDKKCEGEVDTWVLTFSGGGRRTRLHCWRRRQGKGAAVCPRRRWNPPSPPQKKNPSCQSLQRNDQFIYRTLVECSRTDGTQDHICRKVCVPKYTLKRSYEATLEWMNERKKEAPPLLSVFLTGCYGSHPCSRWWQRIRSATLELSDRRTSSAVFGGWRQVQLRPVRLRLMAGDIGLDAGQQARIKILQHKHRRAVLSSAEAPIRLQIPIWREIHSSFHVFPRFTWQTWSPWLHRFAGKMFQALFCFMINFTVSSKELYFLPHFDG